MNQVNKKHHLNHSYNGKVCFTCFFNCRKKEGKIDRQIDQADRKVEDSKKENKKYKIERQKDRKIENRKIRQKDRRQKYRKIER